MRSPLGQFSASACHFVNWDNRAVGSPALQVDAGKAIVTGCTFSEDGLHVQVGAAVTSAILCANQATGGFRVENQAGKRTQMGLNEEDAIVWTAAALSHYRIEVGAAGDGRYVQGCHGRERLDRPFRWSMATTRLVLPVPGGKACTVAMEMTVPGHAVGADSGLYLGDRRLAPLPEAGALLTAELPPAAADRARLELRCQGWVPQQLIPGSADPRTLGVQLFSITVKTADAGETAFNANTGTPVE